MNTTPSKSESRSMKTLSGDTTERFLGKMNAGEVTSGVSYRVVVAVLLFSVCESSSNQTKKTSNRSAYVLLAFYILKTVQIFYALVFGVLPSVNKSFKCHRKSRNGHK